MDIIFMRQCTILSGSPWSVNTWILDATLNIFLEKENSNKFFGLRKSLKR